MDISPNKIIIDLSASQDNLGKIRELVKQETKSWEMSNPTPITNKE